MKKLLVVCLCLCSASAFSADVNFVNADASIYSELCIAAVTSPQALAQKSAEYKVSQADLAKFSCNGLSLADFSKKYGPGSGNTESIKVFSFESMQNMESDICVAAATSNAAFDALKAKLNRPDAFYSEIHCNDVPLSRFAKKYGNKDFRIADY